LYLWEFEGSAQPRRLASRVIGTIECGGFTPEGREFTAMNASGDILTVELTTGRLVSSFQAEGLQVVSGVREVLPSPDGSKLAVAVRTPSGFCVRLLDLKSGKCFCSLPAESGAIYWLAWSPDSRRLAVSRDSGKIAIWELEKVQQILAQLGLKP
jgi:WD40 repeat protein